jgi:hypothetical protein
MKEQESCRLTKRKLINKWFPRYAKPGPIQGSDISVVVSFFLASKN